MDDKEIETTILRFIGDSGIETGVLMKKMKDYYGTDDDTLIMQAYARLCNQWEVFTVINSADGVMYSLLKDQIQNLPMKRIM